MKVSQLSVFIENKPGRLAEVTGTLGKNGINIRALTVADTADFGVLRLIVDKHEEALKKLRDASFTVQTTEVLAIEVPDEPGGVSKILTLLDSKGVNVEYMYAFVAHSHENAVIIFRFDNNDDAIKVLTGNGYNVLEGKKVYNL